MMNGRKVNGVDVTEMKKTIMAITEQPDLGNFQFRATNRWMDGGLNKSTIKGFYGAGLEDGSREMAFEFAADEPPILLGENRGANPVEYLLTALASCVTTSLVYHAAARDIKLESVESRLEGNIDLRGFLGISDDVPRGYKNIRVTFDVKGEATREDLEELCKFSPVYNSLMDGVAVDIRINVTQPAMA